MTPGFIETHIHLDESCILDRCSSNKGDLAEAIEEVAKAKKGFTLEDVYDRAKSTLEKCILNGTTHVRTQLEIDPGIGLRGLDGILPLIDEYKWAIDIEICVSPQEGLLNNPGTDELMVEALKKGGSVVGAAPYTDSNPHGQIDRIFEMAREFGIDVDMHSTLVPTPASWTNRAFGPRRRRTGNLGTMDPPAENGPGVGPVGQNRTGLCRWPEQHWGGRRVAGMR